MISARLQLANFSSARHQSDYAETRYIYAPQRFEGILGAPQAAGVEEVTGNQNSGHGKCTRKSSPTPVNQDTRVENVSEQLQLNLYHQVLVVLRIMITLHQWPILPSSSQETQEREIEL
jgi:hypothetical protein